MGAGLIAYDPPLVEATFLARRKRFFADVRLPDGREVVAHCANTGRMAGLLTAGAPCRVAPARPGLKLAWTLEQIQADGVWVMVHTARPNRLVEAAVRAGALPGLEGYGEVLREQPDAEGSRLDLLLREGPRPPAWVEVKNVTWVRRGVACFPDAVSTRGTRHLRALQARVAAGDRGVLVLLVARGDAQAFAPADDVDPDWAAAWRAARAAGVEVRAVTCVVGAQGLGVGALLPLWSAWPPGVAEDAPAPASG